MASSFSVSFLFAPLLTAATSLIRRTGDRPRNQNTGEEFSLVVPNVSASTQATIVRLLSRNGESLAKHGRIGEILTWITLASRARITVLTSSITKTKHHGKSLPISRACRYLAFKSLLRLFSRIGVDVFQTLRKTGGMYTPSFLRQLGDERLLHREM